MFLSRKRSVLLSPTAEGYLAYDVELDRLHRLNPMAALMIELADGQRTQDEILAAVLPLLAQPDVAGCLQWITQAVAQGLLVADSSLMLEVATLPRTSPFTAAELIETAAVLRNRDRVLAAFICQQHVTELIPANPHQWYQLGTLAHIVGRRLEAREAYERYQSAFPDDAEIEHLLIALRDESPPQRASDRCIEQLYAHFASFYDQNMCGELNYRAPELLLSAIAQEVGSGHDLNALDIGCGTGLFGKLLRPLVQRLVGIDLSAAMIALAHERGVYDQLETVELTAWFNRDPLERFDVIASCDTLIYFGDLMQVLPAAARHLSPGGLLAFTVERGERFPFHLTDSGRFTHHQQHLIAVARVAGYRILRQTEEVLRDEYGESVIGWVTVLQGP